MKPRKASPEGFTLVELMVTLTLIAIVAGLAWPSYAALSLKARRSEARAALLQAMQQQERFFSAHGRYAEFSQASSNGFQWYSGGSPAGSGYELQAQACADATVEECIRISAAPGTAAVNPNAADPACGVLTLDSRGEKTSDGSPTLCWP